jgi:hypothetical protein
VNRFSRVSWRVAFLAAALAIFGVSAARAQSSHHGHDGDHDRPVYKRHAFDRGGHHHGKFGRRFDHNFRSPQINSGWFQRPYPYHLDYYKMRYGGSYAPYFGNLYGPPQVVTAPPYYGPYGYEFMNPGDGAYGMPMGPMAPFQAEEAMPQGEGPQNSDSGPQP